MSIEPFLLAFLGELQALKRARAFKYFEKVRDPLLHGSLYTNGKCKCVRNVRLDRENTLFFVQRCNTNWLIMLAQQEVDVDKSPRGQTKHLPQSMPPFPTQLTKQQ